MELDYKTFKADCFVIIEPILQTYGYLFDNSKSEDYINYYSNDTTLIEVSMLENFPHIGISIDYLTIDEKRIRRSILNNFLRITLKEESNFYKKFNEQNNLNDYPTQMRFAVAVMEKFYKPILTGEIRLEDIVNSDK